MVTGRVMVLTGKTVCMREEVLLVNPHLLECKVVKDVRKTPIIH